MTSEVRTARLLLRRWRPEDEAPMAAINHDPEVTRFLNRPVDEASVQGFHGAVVAHWEQHGFGVGAVEVADGGALDGHMIGFVGLAYPPPFLPDVQGRPELGWRLARESWGRGYATEAALAARDDALERLGITDLMSIIHPDNERSQSVARRLGMHVGFTIHNPLIDRVVDVWEPVSA
jgi:RimJ/RimL family protein N-acetyltransferase